MAQTNIRGGQIKNDDITSADIADAAVRGATSNVGTQREIETGTVSTPDLRDDSVTPAKVDDTANFTMATLSINAGTAGAPSLLITGDVNTGLYSGGADTLSITTGGSERFRVDANGIKVVDGAVGTPSISFTGDITTGLFRPTSGEIAFSSAGTEVMRYNSIGLGIGGAPVTSAILTLTSTTKAFLPPRMTTTQRDAIVSPVAGMVIYNTTTGLLNIYTTSWGAIAAAETDPFSIHKNGDNSPTANINWNQFEIQQVVIHKLASDPGSPVEGQIYYNTTVKQWKGYNGTSWSIMA